MIPKEDVRDAKEKLTGIINATPLQFSQTFSNLTRSQIHLKPECLQKNGSFKIRGAYTMLNRMSREEQKRGIVTFSAGNWAQGVAYGASLLDMKAAVILPEWVNPLKVEATRGYGADVVIHGHDSQELLAKALELHEREGYAYINPFSNVNMIAGAASIGVEIIEEKPDTEAIVAPVGGGALISGVAIGAKQMKPEVKVYGVQPYGANAIYQSLQAGKVVGPIKIESIADGLAVSKPDENALKLVQENVDEIVLISDDEIKEAIFLLMSRAKLVVEPAGATSLAGVLSGKIKEVRNRETVCVLTGGNIDFQLLGSILETKT